MIFRKGLLFLFLIFFIEATCKPPQLNPRDVKSKAEEIFRAHVSHKTMTQDIMQRVFQSYLEEMDPSKTYFLEEEVVCWTSPSQETLSKALKSYFQSDFAVFQEIHDKFLTSIQRRKKLEEKLSSMPLPTGVKSEEFKDLSWVKNEEELVERLCRIKALQTEAVAKLDDDSKVKFFQRLEKKRLNRENEFLTEDLEEKQRLVLANVLKAIACSLDSHTNYFTPSEANQFMIAVQQRLFGIGAQLHDELDGLSVKRIIENSPASQSKKIKINDKIIAVNHEPVVGMDIQEAVELIRGEQGTPVLLTILRETGAENERKVEKLEVELIRNEVVLEESRFESAVEPFADGVIAQVKLFSFYQDNKNSSASDLRKIIDEAKENYNLKGVILDLRGNSGGLLTQAVSVTGLFINKGVVVSIQDNTGKVQHLREVEGRPAWDGPLLVLVNKASASAAEIVAQTLQDYGRALVVGDDHTFGKGSFQTFTLDPLSSQKVNPQGEYKVTRGRYYTVSGKSPQLTGVESDIVIPGVLSQLDIGEKFAKFPLENDQIQSHFEDDLSDLSALHKLQLGPMYRYNLQQKLFTYNAFVDRLKQNSQKRIDLNKNYKSFLAELEKKNFDSEAVNSFNQNDLQLMEAMNVMKDLLFFMSAQAK